MKIVPQVSSVLEVCHLVSHHSLLLLFAVHFTENNGGKFLVFKASSIVPALVPVNEKRVLLFSVFVGEAGRVVCGEQMAFSE